MRKQERGSSSTGDDHIKNEDAGIEGYIVDSRGRIRGEARRYDPYARFGEIMLYEIDGFGFVKGYVSGNWHIMSEQDMLADKRLAKRLYAAKYQIWKRYNIKELKEEYEKLTCFSEDEFERFCRRRFNKVAAN